MPKIQAIDLFCGCGGLTRGLLDASIEVLAGYDLESKAQYAYETNNPGAKFILKDVAEVTGEELNELWDDDAIKVLAGCAPCQPFSRLTNGQRKHKAWDMLDHFARLIKETLPHIVTMENVPELRSRGKDVLDKFLTCLEKFGYKVTCRVVNAAHFGVPQNRKRLVLLASRIGEKIELVEENGDDDAPTVRQIIGHLDAVASGEAHPTDLLHVAAKLSPMNMKRIQNTTHDGGTRKDWPKELLPDCYKRPSGDSYGSIYARMWWNKPAPTMTTLCIGIGNGRFGHPEQNRAITLREAALFQTFGEHYEFWPPDQKLNKGAIAKMIGNAVPPKLAQSLGCAIVTHVEQNN